MEAGASEDEKFEARLVNWGRWLRGGHKAGTTTCTAINLLPDDEFREPGAPAINERDAQLVHRAWSQIPFTYDLYRKAKMLVALMYAYPGRDFDFYRLYLHRQFRLKLIKREFDSLRRESREVLQRAVQRLDKAAAMDTIKTNS